MYRKFSDRKCCVALAGFLGCGLETAVPWVLQPLKASVRWEGLWSPGLALTLPPSLAGCPSHPVAEPIYLQALGGHHIIKSCLGPGLSRPKLKGGEGKA